MGPRIGAHASAAGGVHRALERGEAMGCEALQVFVKSPQQWKGPALDESAVEAFARAREATGIGPVVAHAAYLINLASPERSILERSRRGLLDELRRCSRLGVDALIVHPGAHLGAGERRGLSRIAASVRWVLRRSPEGGTRLLLENTAGQGSVLGSQLEELAEVIERSDASSRLGICIDTCHAFAAGYAVDREKGLEDFWSRLVELMGSEVVGCVHLNDSEYPRGSRRDRHANLGEGEIGPGLFRRLMREERFQELPMVLETPVGEDRRGHASDLAKLRRWRRRAA